MSVFSELYEFNEQLILNLKFNKNPLEKVAQNFKYVPNILKGQKVLDGKDGEMQIGRASCRERVCEAV